MLLLGLAAVIAVLLLAGDREQHAQRGAGRAHLGQLGNRTDPPVRPAPPARYRVPRRAIRVATAGELHAALARRRARAIVLAAGAYGSRRPFLNPHGHHLYAARLGKAVLRAGLSLGGNAGPGGGVVRGIVLDIGDRRRTVGGAAIAVWGSGTRSRILDTTIRGHSVLSSGIEARRPEGLRIARVVARGFTDFGVLVDANDPERIQPDARFRAQDLDIARIGRATPGSSQGRAEACLWVGNPGDVRRVRVRSCAWSGVWTGTAARGCRLAEIDVDEARTGVYLEHYTRDSTFRRLRVGAGVRVGLAAEWAAPEWGRRPASVGNVIEDSRFESRLAGVYLDEGTERTTVRRSTFANQEWAAIGDYRGSGNAYYDNDYGGIAPGAEAVSHDHLTSFREG
jgi:hypothetical protein